MKAKWNLPILTLILAGTACGYAGQAPGPLSDEDVAALRANIDTYVATTLAGDWDSWAELFAEDAVNMPPNDAAAEGRAAIRAWGEAFPAVTAFTSTPDEIVGVGDLAYVRGTYSITIEVDGQAMPDNGKYVVIMRKGADGMWQATTQIWNSNLPIPEGPTPDEM